MDNIDSSKQFIKVKEIETHYSSIRPKINEQTVRFISDYLYRNLGTPIEEIKLIECSGGMTNRNYKITLAEGKELQMRVPGEGTAFLVNRYNEIVNSKAIEPLQLNVPTVYFNMHDGIKITEYIKNVKTLTKQTAIISSNMSHIASILNKLHSSCIKMNNTFSHKFLLGDYECFINDKTNQSYIESKYPNFFRHKEKLESLQYKIMNLNSFSICPCHNDLVPDNFLQSEYGKIYLIDWEYSGYNSPLWDIASFILESELTDSEEQLFLDYYFQRPVLDEEYFLLHYFKCAQDMLWSLWAIVKELHGRCYEDYGSNRYTRGCRLLKELNDC